MTSSSKDFPIEPRPQASFVSRLLCLNRYSIHRPDTAIFWYGIKLALKRVDDRADDPEAMRGGKGRESKLVLQLGFHFQNQLKVSEFVEQILAASVEGKQDSLLHRCFESIDQRL